jgi:putative phosphoesterase
VAKLRSERVTLPIREDGGIKVAIVADTHSEPHPRTVELLKREKPDAILHAGDIGALGVVDQLAAIAPTHAVRGNIDEHALPDDIVLDVGGLTTVFLTHIAVNGPKVRADAARRAHAAAAQIVVCGHSHVPFLGRDKNLVVFNPGSIGPRRFQLPIVFGMMEIADRKLRFEHVSCETGERWLP